MALPDTFTASVPQGNRAAGSVLRHWVQLALNAARFPWGTLAVNVSGSAMIGLLAGLERDPL